MARMHISALGKRPQLLRKLPITLVLTLKRCGSSRSRCLLILFRITVQADWRDIEIWKEIREREKAEQGVKNPDWKPEEHYVSSRHRQRHSMVLVLICRRRHPFKCTIPCTFALREAPYFVQICVTRLLNLTQGSAGDFRRICWPSIIPFWLHTCVICFIPLGQCERIAGCLVTISARTIELKVGSRKRCCHISALNCCHLTLFAKYSCSYSSTNKS